MNDEIYPPVAGPNDERRGRDVPEAWRVERGLEGKCISCPRNSVGRGLSCTEPLGPRAGRPRLGPVNRGLWLLRLFVGFFHEPPCPLDRGLVGEVLQDSRLRARFLDQLAYPLLQLLGGLKLRDQR